MTTYQQTRSIPPAPAQHHRPEASTPVEGTRDRYRAKGWLFAATGAAVLWTAIIGAVAAVLSSV